jgi:hypothetical protein
MKHQLNFSLLGTKEKKKKKERKKSFLFTPKILLGLFDSTSQPQPLSLWETELRISIS